MVHGSEKIKILNDLNTWGMRGTRLKALINFPNLLSSLKPLV